MVVFVSTWAKIGVGVASAAVIVGLGAMALPALAPIGVVAGTAAGLADTLEPATEVTSNPVAAAGGEQEGPAAIEDYVHVGQGTLIPGGGPGVCATSAYIHITKADDSSPWRATLAGDLVDMGPREFAAGEVGYAADGRIATYTVESGDALYAIGDRFCIYNAMTISTLNGYVDRAIQPGHELVLDPAAVPGFEFAYPYPD